jgi:hypothetical protein
LKFSFALQAQEFSVEDFGFSCDTHISSQGLPLSLHQIYISLCSSSTLAETLIIVFLFAAEIFGTYHIFPDIQFFYPRALDQQSLLTNSVNLPYLYQFLEFSGSLIFHSSCVSF